MEQRKLRQRVHYQRSRTKRPINNVTQITKFKCHAPHPCSVSDLSQYMCLPMFYLSALQEKCTFELFDYSFKFVISMVTIIYKNGFAVTSGYFISTLVPGYLLHIVLKVGYIRCMNL